MIRLDTTYLDYPSPDDIAVVMIMAGCCHNCPGCQNPELQQHFGGPLSDKVISMCCQGLLNWCERNETNKVVLSGGDCLFLDNRVLTRTICENFGSKLDICIYTGYSIDEVKQMGIKGFKYIKCGKFDCNNMQESKKTDEYIQFVNKTQNLYDSNYNQLSVDGRFYFNREEKND